MPERYNEHFWAHLDQLVASSAIAIDQPAGSPHPDYPATRYPLDYGYLAGTSSADGAGIDVWVGASGEKRVVGILATVDLVKRDSEIKVLLGCTQDEMLTVVNFHNEHDTLRALLIRRDEA